MSKEYEYHIHANIQYGEPVSFFALLQHFLTVIPPTAGPKQRQMQLRKLANRAKALKYFTKEDFDPIFSNISPCGFSKAYHLHDKMLAEGGPKVNEFMNSLNEYGSACKYANKLSNDMRISE